MTDRLLELDHQTADGFIDTILALNAYETIQQVS